MMDHRMIDYRNMGYRAQNLLARGGCVLPAYASEIHARCVLRKALALSSKWLRASDLATLSPAEARLYAKFLAARRARRAKAELHEADTQADTAQGA